MECYLMSTCYMSLGTRVIEDRRGGTPMVHVSEGREEEPFIMVQGREKKEEEEEEEEEEGKRRRRLAGPEPGWTGPTTGLSGCRPVDRPQDRTTRSQARSDRPQTGSDGNDSPSCLSYPLAYLFGPSWLVPLYKHLGPLLYPLDKMIA
jgi:hypothetical protein